MKKIEYLFIGGVLVGAIVVTGGIILKNTVNRDSQYTQNIPSTKYGDFLAAQHAIYVNDFDSAAQFSMNLDEIEYPIVQNTKYLSQFLSGYMPQNAKLLQNEKSTPAQLIYDAYLIDQGKWKDLYNRHNKDTSALSAPLRIWSSVATGNSADAIKIVDSLPTNTSWKAFARGQIYAATDNTDKALKEFENVRADFMNINDYLYIMSYYQHLGKVDEAAALRTDFTSRPGGMFMLEYDDIPDWKIYSGNKNALAFSLVQNVSHTQVMMYSDLAILLLRFAQITSPDFGNDNDAIHYYLGQFFFNNNGDYARHFSRVSPDSPFHLFAVLRTAEKTGDVRTLKKINKNNPLFVPTTGKLIAHYVQHGEKRSALRVVNRGLKNKDLPDVGRAYFLKSRAQIYFAFGDIDAAQHDLRAASDILIADAEILSLQAKIWAMQNREIENAYEYAMTLVRQSPADIIAWDTLGRVIAVREGTDAALDVLSRVGEVSKTCSSLFEQLGDLYMQIGNTRLARDAYLRAIDLSDDGLVVVPTVQKKLRKIK